VTVLRDGRRIATQAVADTSPQDLVLQIVGRAVVEIGADAAPATRTPLLDVAGAAVVQEEAGRIGPVSFTAGAGEMLALVGLRGAGHHAIGRAIFGAVPLRAGSLRLGGRPIAPADPAAAMAAGIGFVSSRRGEEGLAAAMTVQENLYLNPRAGGIAPWQPLSPRRELARATRALARFSVRPPDPSRPVITLSGGNQQKVVVARWMEARIRLLIMEEPTIGVDVGSKAEIYRDLNGALRGGMAVLLISSDFEEVEKIAHRALVFSRGAVVAEVARAEITVARLTELAAGGADHRQAVA